MKLLDEFLELISKNKVFVIFIAICLSLKGVLVPIYQEYIIDIFLSKFSSSLINDVIFLFVCLFCLIWTISKIYKRFYIQRSTFVYLIFLMLLYTYIRLFYGEYLLRLKTVPSITYLDIIYLFLCCGFVIKILSSKKIRKVLKTDNNLFPIYDDSPIESSSQDVLNRKDLALKVANYVKGNYTLNSTAIGIVGKWGEGKSTFMKFIEESFVNDNRYIIVHFNSWINISAKSIIDDFFTTVEGKIRPHSIDVAKEIKRYGTSIFSIHKNNTTETLLNAVNLITDSSLSDSFDRIEKLLLKLDKRVIVFLDDLDRLQPNEVFETLKLIRNTASFKTFHYVVGYDKDYIIESLKSNHIPNPHKYCEKIFINEFYLLPITRSQTSAYIKKQLYLFVHDKVELSAAFERFNVFARNDEIFNSINTIRDAKRFLVEFSLSFHVVKEEVALKDFILIKLLKFSYYEVYYLLFLNKNKFITNTKKNTYIHGSDIIEINLKEKGSNNVSNFSGSELESFLIEKAYYNREQFDGIKFIFTVLFSDLNAFSFGYNKNYYRYFNDELAKSEISKREFLRVIHSDWDVIEESILSWRNEGRLIGVLAQINHTDIIDLNNKNAYENYLRVLFKLQLLLKNDERQKQISIDYAYVERCVNDNNRRVSQRFYEGDKGQLKSFVTELLNDGEFPYRYEMGFCQYLYSLIFEETGNDILSKQDIEIILVQYFKDIISKHNYNEYDFFDAFYRTELVEKYQLTKDDNRVFERDIVLREIKMLSRDVIKNNPDSFLVDIIEMKRKSSQNHTQKVQVKIHNFILLVFDSYEDFIIFLEENVSSENSLFITEFIDFAKSFLLSNDFITFDFQYEPVLELMRG